MANLEITNATYGRSTTGQKIIATNISGDIDRAVKALDKSSKEYITLKNTIRQYWTGPDANRFLKLLDDQRESIQNKMKSYKNTFKRALENDRTQFNKTQNNIANQLK